MLVTSYSTKIRSSRLQVLYKKGTLKNFANFMIKQTPAVFLNKVWASNLQAY